MGSLDRMTRLVPDLHRYGLLMALARHRIRSPVPLDPSENWDFWTKTRPHWLERIARDYPPVPRRRAYLGSMLARDHGSGIEEHYDVSNDFYFLFLDARYRFYSCGDFEGDRDTLEEAQVRKAAYLLALLRLGGGERVLDLGCGWGAMLRALRDAGHRGELAGYTLSRRQAEYVERELGLPCRRRDFLTDPFEGAPYDRIVSIGAMEHVRPDELAPLYRKMHDAISPGGLAMLQFFSLELEPFPTSMMTAQLFFPGSLLAVHSRHVAAAEDAGFRITHDSVHPYQPTLRAWYDRLAARRERALELVELATFNRFLTLFPMSWRFFEQGEARLHRVVLEKASG